ncbi:hypothetical protein BSKO_13132 [Bryopsis sp. KO-2023]|nr:hypothetical protein BSKO_13132 [Bryopsis sp. KO-2023]
MLRSLSRRRIRRFVSTAEQLVRFSASPCLSSDVYDVVVVGAGMVGAGLAAGLGSNPMTSGLRIAVLDQKVPADKLASPLADVPELRVSTLTPASINLVKNSGAWEAIKPPSSASFSDMQVWDYGAPGCLKWSSTDVGLPEIGIVVENSLLQSAFLKAATARSSVECFFPAQLESIDFPHLSNDGCDSSLVKIKLDKNRAISARLVVGADGAMSRVRSMAGMRTITWDHEQRGVVATVKVDRLTTTAWQRFLPTGPLALLPVRGGFCNVVWSTNPRMAADLEDADGEAIVTALNESLRGAPPSQGSSFLNDLRSFVGVTPPPIFPPDLPVVLDVAEQRPRSFPLKMMYAGRYVCPRLALVGDAAHVVHPLAGQGVNLGLGDVSKLIDAIAEAVEGGQDIGSLSILQSNYEGPRKSANTAMMAALMTIKETFAFGKVPLPAIRGLGLEALDSVHPLKNEIMKYAMGLGRGQAVG